MPAQLIALDEGPSILLDKPILLLGRHPECDIQIDSRKISRRHCCIAQVSDYFVVRDLGSTNGIRINGVRILEGQLNAGDELTIGNHRYRVTWDEVLAQDIPRSPAQPLSPPPKGAKAEGKPSRRKHREASPIKGVEDDILESCDEPVPLDEAEGEAVPMALPAERPDSEPRSSDKENSLYMPDEQDLMRNGERFHADSPVPSPSGSHHPT